MYRALITKNLAYMVKRIDNLEVGSPISVLSDCGFLH